MRMESMDTIDPKALPQENLDACRRKYELANLSWIRR